MPDGTIRSMSGEELNKIMGIGVYDITRSDNGVQLINDRELMMYLANMTGYQCARPNTEWEFDEQGNVTNILFTDYYPINKKN